MDDNSRRQRIRVLKKSSPNGNITVYLGKQDFVDHLTHVDPIGGVILMNPDDLNNKKVFGKVLPAFRYGCNDPDVVGSTLRKDLCFTTNQIYPPRDEMPARTPTRFQELLLKKLGANAHPFYFEFPLKCPASATLLSAIRDPGKLRGVDYEFRVYVAETAGEKQQKSFTTMAKEIGFVVE
ncbi:unnamed protein product [Notodromas monacha]|uniref:Arrestin-like N-terminal domain-containing protein n=1 Tax=Notodromas monacha TaxID=399045 RepID=A0A7R9BY09_9CRUS|nr:unnamed protein product [Notodromas monacha]CAG0922741.1 unnamed protein product [Notodromas monacha]